MHRLFDTGFIRVLTLIKGDERYVFVYDEETSDKTLRTLGRFASSQELSFSWYDAAVLSKRIRNPQNDET